MAEERLAAARVAALFAVAKTAYATTLATSALLVAILWNDFAAAQLLAWFGAVLAVMLCRIAFHRNYLREPGRLPPRVWEARFAAGAIAAGAAWMLPAMLFFPAGEP